MAPTARETAPLEIRFLGDIEVLRGSERLELPPSKKTRALLAYLAVTGRAHRRERLCELLWDVTDDPRAALRWSLSKLRAVVDAADRPRIVADRTTVSFDGAGATIDLLSLRAALAQGPEAAPTEALVAAAEAFRGEFLEGLDLTDFRNFQAWCVAEREQARQLRARILTTLVDRLASRPDDALPHARALVHVDPLNESALARLVRLLAAAGLAEEAERQIEAGRRLFAELGAKPTGELEAAWRASRGGPGAAARTAEAERPLAAEAAEPDGAPRPAMVGRASERRRLDELFEEVASRRRAHMVLVTGEPGVGKSRLLADLLDRARAAGATVLEGRAFEAESGRPYGLWIDALRALPPVAVGPTIAKDLAPLIPELGGEGGAEPSRDRLFGAVAELIAARAHSVPPVVLAFDDLQWCDEASAALLHYVARMSRHRPLLVALAAREGDLLDNAVLARLLAGLRRDRALEEISLGPLGAEETGALVREMVPEADAAHVYAACAGNPLYALELARSLRDARDGAPPPTLAGLVRDRVSRLPAEAVDVLRWAAVLGSAFGIDRLQALTSLDFEGLVGALEVLERHGLLREEPARRGASGAYGFVHDVVRQVVYAEMSDPRRRLMHGRVARMLEGGAASDDTAASDLAHHAALAGEVALAARGCVAAGRRCLRLFANEQAETFPRKGIRYAEELPERERVPFLLDLAHVCFLARRPADPDEAAARIESLAERALDVGAHEQARLGFHMLAYLRWECGNWSEAQRVALRAEMVSRGATDDDRVVAMAEAARCLVLLERDLGQARSLAEEAEALARRTGRNASVTADATGLLRLHAGRLDEAAARFQQARTLARLEGDRLGEFEALEHMIRVEIRRERFAEAAPLTEELCALGDRLREGSEAAFARVLRALVAYAKDHAVAAAGLVEALEALRAADAKHRLVFALTRAAFMDLRRGDAARARDAARESLAIARQLAHPSEIALAHIALARAASALGDDGTLKRQLTDLAEESLRGVSAEVRDALEAVLATRR